MEDTECIELRDEHIRHFQEPGFLRLGRLTTDREIVWLRNVYDEIVKQKTGYTPDERGHITVEPYQESLMTILSPERIVPELKDTIFCRNVHMVFARLFAVEETLLLTGWRMYCKRAHSKETPWHQDAAYRPPPHRSASVWLPLDPATLESGCMYYISRSHHEGVRPHHFHDDLLVVDDIDPTQGIACLLSAGEAVVHHCCTLHSAGPNKTDQSRRALAVVCQVMQSGMLRPNPA
jgi:ectoine hydroxylase-related dioxygenase (phytanoyl-CoA dioxygenase family)